MLEPTRLNSTPNFSRGPLPTKVKPFKRFDEAGHFKEMQVGAGLGTMKHLKNGVSFQDKFYFIKASTAQPIMAIDQDSTLSFSADAAITWASGRSITADASSMTANGNWLVLGGVRATGYTTRVGSTDYSDVADLSEANVNEFSIEIKGGLIVNFNKNS